MRKLCYIKNDWGILQDPSGQYVVVAKIDACHVTAVSWVPRGSDLDQAVEYGLSIRYCPWFTACQSHPVNPILTLSHSVF
jgi:hypothetical protein